MVLIKLKPDFVQVKLLCCYVPLIYGYEFDNVVKYCIVDVSIVFLEQINSKNLHVYLFSLFY